MGPVLETVATSRDVEGTSYEESGWRANSFLLRLFKVPGRPSCFASSVVTPRGYKASDRSSAQPMTSCTISHRIPTSFPMAEKKEK
jgi:hypothetical protein